MDKRFVAWLGMSLAIFIVYVQFFGPPPQKPDPNAPANVAQRRDNPAGDDKDAEGKDAPPDAAAEKGGDAAPGGDDRADPNAPPKNGDAPRDAPEPPLRYVTLGSAEPGGPYRFLATLTNEGAAVRRLELSSMRFRNLHERSGRIGHLEPIDAPKGGALVQVVGEGTPAAAAGIQVGDVITAIDGVTIASAAELGETLRGYRPGAEVAVTIRRETGAGDAVRQVNATLRRQPLELIQPEIDNIKQRDGEIPEGFIDPASFLVSLSQVGTSKLGSEAVELANAAFRTGRWEIEPGADINSVTFRKASAAHGVEILKTFSVEAVPEDERDNPTYPAYQMRMKIALRSTDGSKKEAAYLLDGPTGLPTEGWWYATRIGREWGAAGLRDVAYRYEGAAPGEKSASELADEGTISIRSEAGLAYAGVDAQYFASVLFPEKKSLAEKWFGNVEAIRIGPLVNHSITKKTLTNVTCRFHRDPIALPASGDLAPADDYLIFCGPKRPGLLAQYSAGDQSEYSLSDLIYFGWPIWGVVARVMSGVLHTFYGLVGNYGIAIICLTIVVRGGMFPLSRKQALNMAKMAELKPEMEKINEKYKNDLEKKTRAQQELWRKNNYNPMGGCLPALIQLPIFIGLYRALMIDVELRQAPLISESIRWCSNLAAPDMLWNWSSFMPEFIQGWLGPYLNILPLVTVGLFVLQQKMFMPPPMNEQAEMQQKVMKFMMLFMGVLFFKVASGLCLYFIASSLWGIAERKLLPHPTPNLQAGGNAGGAADATKASPPDRGGGKMAAQSNGKAGGSSRKKSGTKRKR